MSYRLDVKYRYGMSTANEVLIADGTSESAAKEAIFLSLSRQVFMLIPLCLLLPLLPDPSLLIYKFTNLPIDDCSLPTAPATLGLKGVWWAWPISDFAAFLMAAYMLVRQIRIFNQLHLDQQQLIAAEEDFISDN